MESSYRVGEWTVVPELRRIDKDGRVCHLEPKVMDVLVCLIEANGALVSREQLIRRVWPDTFVTDDVVKRSVWLLRRAFEDDPKSPRVIETISKGGYRLLLPVSVASDVDNSKKDSRRRVSPIRVSALGFTLAAAASGLLFISGVAPLAPRG